MNRLTLNSYAKVNLYLKVLNKRKDNYHNINTVFEKIDLCDKITLVSRKDKQIKISCNLPGLSKNPSGNLAWCSAKLLQNRLKVKKGAQIKIIKRIPQAAGLGGGSSNAAAVLVGLNRLWKLNLSRNKLLDYAKKIGSDVPFFIFKSPFAYGRGRGDCIRPLKALSRLKFWHILIVPHKKISTPKVYKEWDRLKTKLTIPRHDDRILHLALKERGLPLPENALFNGLELVTAKLYPEISQIKESLRHLGVKSILMSGSGPAVFGIVYSRKEAVSLAKFLKKSNRLWRVFVTQTCFSRQ